MRRFITILSVAVICGALASPTVDARGRNNNGGGNQTQQNAPAKNPQSNKNNGSTRPGNGGGNSSARPGGNHGGNSQGRPGNNGGYKPNNGGNNGPGHNNAMPNHGGNNHGGNNHGGNNHGGNSHGGNNHGGNHSVAPGPNHGGPGHSFGPGGNHGHNRPPSVAAIPNHRPPRPLMMEYHAPFARPVPPPAFRPGPRYPTIRTILGITIGSAINWSLNQLFDAGYYVTGYTNDAVYINDVRQLNMLWPNATLYYDRGMLVGSEFVYSTPYYDTARYYSTYNALTSAYGPPAVRNNMAGGFICSWFGYDGNYVTLQFQSAVAYNGTSRYYTTLSFGN